MGSSVIKEIENRKRHKDSWGDQSYIICPECNKEIDYYWSGFAGVEWAKCRTEDCFNFNKKLVPRKKPKLIKRKKPKLVKRKQLTLI